ncbi:hypothetical protein OC835_003146 [Tilletia horrida]|nr:hypothetical protein OC835_003146 [Tilletia horrida]
MSLMLVLPPAGSGSGVSHCDTGHLPEDEQLGSAGTGAAANGREAGSPSTQTAVSGNPITTCTASVPGAIGRAVSPSPSAAEVEAITSCTASVPGAIGRAVSPSPSAAEVEASPYLCIFNDAQECFDFAAGASEALSPVESTLSTRAVLPSVTLPSAPTSTAGSSNHLPLEIASAATHTGTDTASLTSSTTCMPTDQPLSPSDPGFIGPRWPYPVDADGLVWDPGWAGYDARELYWARRTFHYGTAFIPRDRHGQRIPLRTRRMKLIPPLRPS